MAMNRSLSRKITVAVNRSRPHRERRLAAAAALRALRHTHPALAKALARELRQRTAEHHFLDEMFQASDRARGSLETEVAKLEQRFLGKILS